MAAKYRVIGTPVRKVDGMSKCLGVDQYADDIFLPRMIYAKIHRSPVAHALIKSIDTSKAEAMPGVFAVLTGKEMPIPFGILPISQDEHALCFDKVRFIGDPVAAVAAVDEATAFDAMNAIEVEYEKLKPILSIKDALNNPEPRIHDYGDEGNIHKKVGLEFGDMRAGFEEADEIFEDTMFFEGNTHLPMEQHASVGVVDPDGKVTVHSSTQTPHYLHRALSKVLEMSPAHVRVIAKHNGGGFGGKSDPFNHEIVVAKLAQKTGRPVKISLTREEVFYCHRGRHPVLMNIKTGVKKDGSITAMDFKSFLDGGGYGSYGVASTYYTGALQTVTYRNFSGESARVNFS
ncbi:MAG: molybdopterin-dependent oxidoreductase, partial [Planctomycetota bacterium]|nr:molybdopterin-dependent oxidoreductase [Planctomycetota bacterium]